MYLQMRAGWKSLPAHWNTSVVIWPRWCRASFLNFLQAGSCWESRAPGRRIAAYSTIFRFFLDLAPSKVILSASARTSVPKPFGESAVGLIRRTA
jgi:hypothetical protein